MGGGFGGVGQGPSPPKPAFSLLSQPNTRSAAPRQPQPSRVGSETTWPTLTLDWRVVSVLRLLLNEYGIFDLDSLVRCDGGDQSDAAGSIGCEAMLSERGLPRVVAQRQAAPTWFVGRRGHATHCVLGRGEHGYGCLRQAICELHGHANDGLPWCTDGVLLVWRQHE